ncbi:beta-galactosidase, partial [Mesotoga sp. SC_4PWA21]
MKWFGAAYYPEHWPRERWKEDVKVMREMGMNVVRIGEFSWSIVERERGKIDFSVLDEVIDLLDSEGIKVIMGTPTCTPPPWLIKEFPEILQRDVNGLLIASGSRRHYCFNSTIYRKETARIVEAFADHFGRDPRIVAWQIDNEYGCHNSTVCYCENCATSFRHWLKRKYGSIENLNRAWGTVFWSQTFNKWEEIDPPRRTLTSPNPSLVLDYRRFSSDSAINYHNLQREIIEPKSEAPITHNLMVNFTEIDYKKLSDSIDFVSWDNYIAEDYDPDLQALNHDLMRSLKKKPFLVMEQQPG